MNIALKITIGLTVLLWIIGGFIMVTELLGNAPDGYEDGKGFHVGKEPTE